MYQGSTFRPSLLIRSTGPESCVQCPEERLSLGQCNRNYESSMQHTGCSMQQVAGSNPSIGLEMRGSGKEITATYVSVDSASLGPQRLRIMSGIICYCLSALSESDCEAVSKNHPNRRY